MADIITKQQRSKLMSSVKGRDSKIELTLRRFLFQHGFRFRKNYKRLPGTPDVALPKYSIVIFVHGCFWHGHSNCTKAKLPTSNQDFWASKIKRNVARDSEIVSRLQRLGWTVITVWGCELRNNDVKEKTLNNLLCKIKSIGG